MCVSADTSSEDAFSAISGTITGGASAEVISPDTGTVHNGGAGGPGLREYLIETVTNTHNIIAIARIATIAFSFSLVGRLLKILGTPLS
jgi:hypothetical protein